jgi:chaperonin GroEL (HSP60 family)
VREANIEAAKAVADAVRTSLGPRGMDKMVRIVLMFVIVQPNTTQLVFSVTYSTSRPGAFQALLPNASAVVFCR